MALRDFTPRLLCAKCGQTKTLDCFYVETRKGYTRQDSCGRRFPCKECHRAASHLYAKDYCHRPEVKERRKKQPVNKALRRKYHLKANYGLTPAGYEELLRRQGGGCALCGVTHSIGRNKTKIRLCVDHDHDTGRVRGLLCSRCNKLLAKMGDNLSGVMRFVNYLTNPPSDTFLNKAKRAVRHV